MMKTPQPRPASRLSPVFASMVAAYLAMGMAQSAQAEGFERGPSPTAESLQAAAGPYALDTYKISRMAAGSYGYGGATVYFPKALQAAGQRFGVVTFTPGFSGVQATYAPLAARIASHGFVVVNIDTVTTFDQPPQRATQMAGAMRQVVAMAKAGSVPFAKVADVTRKAVVGHSMGGGGTLIAAAANDALKAAVALTPWSQLRKDFSGDKVPTMIVACEKDTIATNAQHADVFYASLDAGLPRAEVEVKGAGHMCATASGSAAAQTTVVKSAVAWLKLHMDEDQRYLPLVNGDMNVGDYSRYEVKGL